nr:tyrosine-type recombinase/integrase [Porphyromonas gulae]
MEKCDQHCSHSTPMELLSKTNACGTREQLTWHVPRRSFGTMTLEAGIPMESIAGMMGYSSISSTQIYAQITDQKIWDMDRLMKPGKI